MNKKVLIAVGAVIVAVIAGVSVLLFNKPSVDDSTTTASSSTAATFAAVKACDLLTLAEAKQLMSESTTAGSNTDPTKSDDISFDNCSYTNNATSVPAIRVVTVTVRSALTNDGVTSNKDAFESGGAANPSGATAVSGYGDKAYWDSTSHQLAILKDNAWIAIVYGGTNPANNTLDDAKKVADLVAK